MSFEQEAEAGEWAGSSAMESFLGWRPDKQPGQSPEEDLQQTHHVYGNTAVITVCCACNPVHRYLSGSWNGMFPIFVLVCRKDPIMVLWWPWRETFRSTLKPDTTRSGRPWQSDHVSVTRWCWQSSNPADCVSCRETWQLSNTSTRNASNWPGRFCLN